MPSFNTFDESINNIYENFLIKNKKLVKTFLNKRHYKYFYHMHPNRRLKKFFLIYPYKITNGIETNMPFFTISVNKVIKNNKNNFICIYNNFYEGKVKEIKLKFSTKEDNISIKYNIKQLQKVIKMIKYAFDELTKSFIGTVNFYKQ